MPVCSVIVCVHNPPAHHLSAMFEGLKAQTLDRQQWELLVVDNQSDPPLATALDLSWHPAARCVREETLGLSAARCRGIQETTSDLIVFVDGDNVLAPGYLEQALAIADERPAIGVWSGQAIASFEQPPPAWTRPYWPMLAIREFEHDHTMMTFDRAHPLPHGAGMCVRRRIAAAYAESFQASPWRSMLERRGESLMSGGDSDIAMLSMEFGSGVGSFARLRLTHLIPPQRLTETYLLQLTEANVASSLLLEQCRTPARAQPSSLRSWLRYLRHWLRPDSLERRIQLAVLEGERRGRAMLRSLRRQPPQAHV